MSGDVPAPMSERIDRWLWCARLFKTRTLATKFVADGNLRLTRDARTARVEKPSAVVRPGDILIFTRGDHLRVIEIGAIPLRRGPASEARGLYIDQSPPPPAKKARKPAPFEREKGAGRPTKKDRRVLDALKSS